MFEMAKNAAVCQISTCRDVNERRLLSTETSLTLTASGFHCPHEANQSTRSGSQKPRGFLECHGRRGRQSAEFSGVAHKTEIYDHPWQNFTNVTTTICICVEEACLEPVPAEVSITR